MPRPLSERESLEQEQAELASGITTYRQELEYGALRRVRREYLAWQIEHAERRQQEAIRLYRSMIAFAGRYELVGNRLIYRPEISWNESWNGSTQERVFQVNGDRLEVKSVPAVSTLTGARTVFSLAWQRAI